jgi:cysteine-rich repeat protein
MVNSKKEQCDDGNYINGDGCSRSCKFETATTKKISVRRVSYKNPTTTTPVETVITPVVLAVKSLGNFDGTISKMLKSNNKVFFDIVTQAINKHSYTKQIEITDVLLT